MLAIQSKSGLKSRYAMVVLRAGLESFWSCAIYFAIAVELAAIVMLVYKDFGVSTTDFGSTDTQIALAISVVCMLPLMYPIALLPSGVVDAPQVSHHQGELEADRALRALERTKHRLRAFLFTILIVSFIYPFISQCLRNWGSSRIGEGNGPGGETLATWDEWDRVVDMCTGGEAQLSAHDFMALAAFELIGSSVLFAFGICLLIDAGIRRWRGDNSDQDETRGFMGQLIRMQFSMRRIWKDYLVVRVSCVLAPLALSCPLLWAIFRLRIIQKQLDTRSGSSYANNTWGFGQVVGIVIFLPVIPEVLFTGWTKRSLLSQEKLTAESNQDAQMPNGLPIVQKKSEPLQVNEVSTFLPLTHNQILRHSARLTTW